MVENVPDLLMVKGQANLNRPERPKSSHLILQGALRNACGNEIPARVVRRKNQFKVKARFDRTTPPGRHSAVLQLDDEAVPLTIEIAERKRVRLRPSALSFVTKPGKVLTADVCIENRGNVPVNVPNKAVAGVFASDGVASAFSAAYTHDTEDPHEMIGELMLGLRKSYLGLARLNLVGLSDQIEAGQQQLVKVKITLPKGAEKPAKNRRYNTTFVLGMTRLIVRFTFDK